MAIGAAIQQVATTLAVLKADVSDYKAKMREVTGAEREAVKAQLDAAEARNKSLQTWAERLTKVNVAITGVTKALEYGAEATKALDERQRLSQAAAAYNLDALRKASQGLRTDTDLLRLAQMSANTTYKLTQSQLENAVKAMRAFERAGFDYQQVADKVREAIRDGNVGPLKELGVNLDATGTKAQQFAQLMQVLGEKARGAGSSQLSANEQFRQAGVEWQNAMESLKISVGRLVVSLEPLISAIAKVGSAVASIVGAIPPALLTAIATAGGAYYASRKLGGAGRVGQAVPLLGTGIVLGTEVGNYVGDEYMSSLTGGIRDRRIAEMNAQREAGAASYITALDEKIAWQDVAELRRLIASNEKLLQALGIQVGAPKKRTGGSGSSRRRRPLSFEYEDRSGATGGSGDLSGVLGSDYGPSTDQLGVSVMFGDLAQRFQGLTGDFAEVGAEWAGRKSVLQSIFGPFDEYDLYAEKMQTLGDVVSGFSGALSAGFDAWVSGSKTAAQAIKGLFADTINAIAKSLFAHALEHGAMAIGSLAFQDYRGAALHGKAAAAYAAGAIAVGGIARQLNMGAAGAGAGATAGAGGAPNVIGPAAGGGSRGSNVTVIIGDSTADDSPRWRQRRVTEQIRRAQRYSSDDGSVQYR